MKPLNDTIRFLVEIASIMLLITAGLGFNNLLSKIIFAGLVPLALVVVWGTYMAPKSTKRLSETKRLVVEVLFFGYTAVMAWFMISSPIAVIYAIVTLINTYLDHRL